MEEWQTDWPDLSKMISRFDDWPELTELFEQNDSFREDDQARNVHSLNHTQKFNENSRQLSKMSNIDEVPAFQNEKFAENEIFAVTVNQEILNDRSVGNVSFATKPQVVNDELFIAQKESAQQQGQLMVENLWTPGFDVSEVTTKDTFHTAKSSSPFDFEPITLLKNNNNCFSRQSSTENDPCGTVEHSNDQNLRVDSQAQSSDTSNSSSIDQFTLESIIVPLDEHDMRRFFESEDEKNHDVLLTNQDHSAATLDPPATDSLKRSRNDTKRPRKKARQSNIQGKIGLPMQPIKPLAPYNFFFRDERDNLCFGEYGPDGSLPPPVCDFSYEKQQKLLADHWYIDPFKGKRKHRKNHGRVSFTELSSIIAERWRDLSIAGREFYERLAQLDLAHYEQTLSRTKKPNRITLFSSPAYQPVPKQSISEQDMSWLDEEERMWEWDNDSI